MGDRHIDEAARAIAEGDLDAFRRVAAAAARQRHDGGESLVGLVARAVTGNVSLPLRSGSPEQRAMLDVAIEAGADVNAADDAGWTPLHSAAMSGDAELAAALLAFGADPTAVEGKVEASTPPQFALFYAHTKTAALLVDARPGPLNLRTAACLSRLEALAECFGADGEMLPHAWRGREFYRPLDLFPRFTPSLEPQETLDEALAWAARHGAIDAMAALVEHGARVDSNAYRGTALLWATYGKQHAAMRWLLAHGADPNQVHDFGGAQHGHQATAMHLAAHYHDAATVRVLLEGGADPTIEDAAYHGSPLDWARHFGNDEVADLLSSWKRT